MRRSFAPFDALPARRAAFIADPDGAVFGIWQAYEREGAQRVDEARTWAMSALITSDPDAAGAFYGDVFGWTTQAVDSGSESITIFRLRGYIGGKPEQPLPCDVVAIMLKNTGFDAMPQWRVNFLIDDIDDAVVRAQRLGATLAVALYDAPTFRQAVLP